MQAFYSGQLALNLPPGLGRRTAPHAAGADRPHRSSGGAATHAPSHDLWAVLIAVITHSAGIGHILAHTLNDLQPFLLELLQSSFVADEFNRRNLAHVMPVAGVQYPSKPA